MTEDSTPVRTDWSRVWIDLTDLLSWSGSATGVQRVVANLAEPLLRCGARGCAYDPRRAQFTEVDRALELVRAVAQPKQGESEKDQRSGLAHVRSVSRILLTKLERAVVQSQGLARAWGSTRERLHELTASVRRLDSRRVARFRRGDLVLVLGMAWRDMRGLEQIAEAQDERGVRVVSLLYDLTPVLLPHVHPGLACTYARYLGEIARLSSAVVSISATTARDFIAFAADNGLAPVDSPVIRLGDEIDVEPAIRPPVTDLEGSGFILYVSTFEPRKNHQLLYMVWKLAYERSIDLPRLVLVGRQGWMAGDIMYLLGNDPDIQRSVVFVHHADDRDLRWLYERCTLTIYPSVYEGWGLPVAESMRLGKPVLAARTPVLEEAGGDLVDYFSPFDPSECLDVLLHRLSPERLRSRELEIAERFAPQSWATCSAEFQRILEPLVCDPATPRGASHNSIPKSESRGPRRGW